MKKGHGGMGDLASIKTSIRDAFAAVAYPGDWCLINSREGTEPFLLEQEFKGKDQSPALRRAHVV